jgi:hypothetical protein
VTKTKREREVNGYKHRKARKNEREEKENFHGARMPSKRETEVSWSEEDTQERDKSVCTVAPLHHAVMLIVYLGYAALRRCTTR